MQWWLESEIIGEHRLFTFIRVSEILNELQALAEPGKDGELALERTRPEEEIEHTLVVDLARLPVRVGHRNLVEIWSRWKWAIN